MPTPSHRRVQLDPLRENNLKNAIAHKPKNDTPYLALAQAYQTAGKIRKAIHVLQTARKYVADNHNYKILTLLASLLMDKSAYEEATAVIENLNQCYPHNGAIVLNLSYCLLKSNRFEKAAQMSAHALRIGAPAHHALHNLAFAYAALGKIVPACSALHALIRHNPNDLTTPIGVIDKLRARSLDDVAHKLTSIILAHEPHQPDMLQFHVTYLLDEQRGEEALAALARARERFTDRETITNFRIAEINALRRSRGIKAAAEAARCLVDEEPNHPQAMITFAHLLIGGHDPDLGYQWARRLLYAHKRSDPFIRHNAGILRSLFRYGCDHEAIDVLGSLKDCLQDIEAEMIPAGMLSLLADGDSDKNITLLHEAHRRWARATKSSLLAESPELRYRPRRRSKQRSVVRVGLLSSDLRRHSVGRFIQPLIERHDSSCIEIYVYSPYPDPSDDWARKLESHYDGYHRVAGLKPAALAHVIRNDRLDVLIEMNGLTMYGRPDVITVPLAPVQAVWLGYPFSLGSDAVNYYIVDQYLAPVRRELMIEEPLILPGSWLCYTPIADRKPGPAPFTDNNIITFGVLNNPYKFSSATFDMWAGTLMAVSKSRLLVIRPECKSAIMKSHIIHALTTRGVSIDRIGFIDNWTINMSIWEAYENIDIALDCWPLTGGTTTFDALEMGVPTITRTGDATHQRISACTLSHIGAQELITEDRDSFVACAYELANDPERLIDYRKSLRDRLISSALCDGIGFTENFTRAMEHIISQPIPRRIRRQHENKKANI